MALVSLNYLCDGADGNIRRGRNNYSTTTTIQTKLETTWTFLTFRSATPHSVVAFGSFAFPSFTYWCSGENVLNAYTDIFFKMEVTITVLC